MILQKKILENIYKENSFDLQDAVENVNSLPVSKFKQASKQNHEKSKKRKRNLESPVINETPKIKKLKLTTDENPVQKSSLVRLGGLSLHFVIISWNT